MDRVGRISLGIPTTPTVRAALWLCALSAIAVSCAAPPIKPLPPAPSFRLAVLDFAVPSEWRDPVMPDKLKKERKGWWFGSRDIWRNPGYGRAAADALAREMNQLPFVHMVSRADVAYYMGAKLKLIRETLDEQRRKLEKSDNLKDWQEAERIRALTDADYDRLVETLPPREIGRELKVDRVLVGRVHEAYLAHNRTIHWYWSRVDIEAQLIDVESGKALWSRRAPFSGNIASPSLLLENAAKWMVEAMKNECFYAAAK